jgi:small ligand-binding sensory domain FIST
MQGDREPLIEAAVVASTAATDALHGEAPIGMFVFDCCVRPMALGENDADAAATRLTKSLGALPFGAFYTNGEIARTSGARGMHHLTVVALAVS